MTFSQIHERLRLELLRRIQRGTLSVSLLARQTGFGQAHVSNFLRQRRQLSLQGLDRILAAQHLAAADLVLAANPRYQPVPLRDDLGSIPVVPHATALDEPFVRASAVCDTLHLPAAVLRAAHPRAAASRRAWQRFVAVRIAEADVPPMQPLLFSGALVVLDRHYTSLMPHRAGRSNLYAVRSGAHLTIRYLEMLAGHLVLRPHNLNFPISSVDVEAGSAPAGFIAGRVLLILNET